MKKVALTILLLFGLATASFLWVRPFDRGDTTLPEIPLDEPTLTPAPTIPATPIATLQPGSSSPHPDELHSQLVGSTDYWSYSLRSHLLALPPSELLDLLERDDILARDDARDLIIDLDSWCAGALMFQKETVQKNNEGLELKFSDERLFERVKTAFDDGWCGTLARVPDAYDRMRRLREMIRATDLPDRDRYERLTTHVQQAVALHDGSLQVLMASDRADLISIGMHELWRQRDLSIITDWTALDNLAPDQAWETLSYLRIGLECQQMGGCSIRESPAISAACFNIGLQCDAGRDFYSIMRRSLSPAQFEALMVLMNGVTAYRQQYGG